MLGFRYMSEGEPLIDPSFQNERNILLEQLRGYQVTSLLYVAAKLELPDRLTEGPLSNLQLAQQLNADPLSMHRFLRGLAVIGILSEEENGRFGVTERGQLLRKENPLWGDAILAGELRYQTWGALLETVQTGKSGMDIVFGMGLFDYLTIHPDTRMAFDVSMSGRTQGVTQAILAALDEHHLVAETIVDVGGGTGTLLTEVLKANPNTTGVLLEESSVASRAQRTIETDGLTDRCRVVEGNFLLEVPASGDVYFLKHIIHDWNDEDSIRILANCRRAMSNHANLLVIETVLPERAEDAPDAIWLDLRMLTNLAGRERTATEHRSLLEQAGLQLTQIVPTKSEVSILVSSQL